MPENPSLTVTRMRTASVLFSLAALVFLAAGLLLSLPRVAVLIVPVLLGAVALILAIRARHSTTARPSRVVAFLLSVLAIVAPVVAVVAVLLAGVLAPSAVYTLTVDSPDPVTVVIRNGADSTTAQWNSGRSITLDSNQTVVGINAKSSTDTTVISCELRRDGTTVATQERAGSVDCGYNAGRD